MIGVFYFYGRPQQKRAKKEDQFVEELSKGRRLLQVLVSMEKL